MSLCVLCNRTFGSGKALKQHEENSPKHAETFGCKPCNRSFGSLDALGQHQDNSLAHRKPRKDSALSSVTPVSLAPYAPLQFSTSSNVRSTIRNDRRSGHAVTENISHTNSTFDLPFAVLQSRMQALTIPDLQTSIVAAKIYQAHINTRQEETRTFFTFPELHQSVAEAVAPSIISTWFNNDIDAHFNNKHTTCVMGKFTCDNNACRKKRWSSKVVATWIQGYPRNGYNAIVFNQRCESCNCLGSFKLDEKSYVDRIAYRLKKWAGVIVEPPPFPLKTTPRHETDLCEGCKVGKCPKTPKLGFS
ncbi:hypothetical protein COCC4DRAFT_154982 [Bipolaris maydis ATCC 48331]|uniref:C2H2-type domain-containing protein n=2 Tax=Cochliobolus heterostrophus TaxID=5016 RepID=M2TGV0_COCH5|nr:uncharacterized protein COCC4DRAFT_154982 [Bipolaris maydis ATCC 48331]EMD96670.1 hypothetical protein COCHEDRAFT_1025187 [Bipolaris maydis C5]KAJ5031449.1 zinc-binding domain-containing protein [Bipolaris maydis]ENH98765.1 hypothetical protein COCC4DRAFT_154982 [Bipolaris maydis ATCC 48331]KAJ5060511.1 zinc-binding domain-containing protein [Bipolaris maydis]KAJ6201661.1 zinc-binding domain-containing protein [Bipolaris maydis]